MTEKQLEICNEIAAKFLAPLGPFVSNHPKAIETARAIAYEAYCQGWKDAHNSVVISENPPPPDSF